MRNILSLSIAFLLSLVSLSTCSASLAQFAGDWTNVDTNTGGLTTLSIGVSGTSATVHVWGRCHPTDCDWGEVQAVAFAPDVSSDMVSQARALVAIYDEGFKETTLIIKPQGNRLSVQSYSRFKDGSGRSNYRSDDLFQKSSSTTSLGLLPDINIRPLTQFQKLDVQPDLDVKPGLAIQPNLSIQPDLVIQPDQSKRKMVHRVIGDDL